MSHRQPIREVQNYTDAFLTTVGVCLFVVLWMIAAALGYAWVAVTAYCVDHVFRLVGRLKSN
jgi:threonine/homoserine/homoserine lactone efflux protein